MTKKKSLKPVKRIAKKTALKEKLSPLGKSVLQGLQEAVAYKRGELTEGKGVKVHYYHIPEHVDVRSIRKKLGLTQEEFAQFGFTVSAIRHWEQGLRQPEGAARVLLKVIEHNPKTVLDALR